MSYNRHSKICRRGRHQALKYIVACGTPERGFATKENGSIGNKDHNDNNKLGRDNSSSNSSSGYKRKREFARTLLTKPSTTELTFAVNGEFRTALVNVMFKSNAAGSSKRPRTLSTLRLL